MASAVQWGVQRNRRQNKNFSVYCTTKIDNPHLKFVSAAVSRTVDLNISICALELERISHGAKLFKREFNWKLWIIAVNNSFMFWLRSPPNLCLIQAANKLVIKGLNFQRERMSQCAIEFVFANVEIAEIVSNKSVWWVCGPVFGKNIGSLVLRWKCFLQVPSKSELTAAEKVDETCHLFTWQNKRKKPINTL